MFMQSRKCLTKFKSWRDSSLNGLDSPSPEAYYLRFYIILGKGIHQIMDMDAVRDMIICDHNRHEETKRLHLGMKIEVRRRKVTRHLNHFFRAPFLFVFLSFLRFLIKFFMFSSRFS
ncbi:uncharacterized protein DS421_13g416660 [Arachis hypogaea]|nr:uncharacterized protein DS421_13g416660 [Arachis hypogaea]